MLESFYLLKKNLNASRPSEYPLVRGEMLKRLGGIIGCKYKTPSWHLNGFLDGINILGQPYNVGEKPTVMQINYNMTCIASPRKDHLTFLRRKPSPSLNTYYVPTPIQVSRFKHSNSKQRRPLEAVPSHRARVVYKYSFLVTNSTRKLAA